MVYTQEYRNDKKAIKDAVINGFITSFEGREMLKIARTKGLRLYREDREESKRKYNLHKERMGLISPYVEGCFIDLSEKTEEEFQSMLSDLKK